MGGVFFCEQDRLFWCDTLGYAWAMRSTLFLLLILLSLPLLAKDVYKWTTPEGDVVYSDSYQQGAEKVHVNRDSRTPAPADVNANAATDEQAGSAAGGDYQTFEIAQPKNDETIRSDEGVVSVSLLLSPTLAAGDAIQVFVDGNKLGEDVKSAQFTLNGMNRGTHTLQAKIVSADGNILKSAPGINFHIRQASIIKP
jgi:hypothetical protein